MGPCLKSAGLNENVRVEVPCPVAALALMVTIVTSWEPGGDGSAAVKFKIRPFGWLPVRKRHWCAPSNASLDRNPQGCAERRTPLKTSTDPLHAPSFSPRPSSNRTLTGVCLLSENTCKAETSGAPASETRRTLSVRRYPVPGKFLARGFSASANGA